MNVCLCVVALLLGRLANGTFNASTLSTILQNHITGVAGAASITSLPYCWDVVNEALGENGKLKPADPWYPTLPNYVDVAFRAAAQVAGRR